VSAQSGRWEVLVNGLWKENPTLVTVLGLCPTLAVTNSVENAGVMGIATLFVLVASSFLVSCVRKVVPNQVRISTFVLIIATFVTVADMVLEAVVPKVHRQLGAFIALIVVNCIILGRAEAFASKNTVGRSTLDAIGQGVGFTLVLLAMGGPRELLGAGTILGYNVMGPRFEPWVIMILPPGGFLMIALLLIGKNWLALRSAEPKPARQAALAAARAAAGRVPAPEREGALV
jgi:Na+-translocating ferredoxin:NAD+ oxidoreductase subunit E